MNPQDNINLHSEELNEALGTPPSWLAKFGVLTAYISILIMVGIAYFVKYPDVVKAKMELVVPNPSVEIVAKQTGLIEQVFVEDNEIVEVGQWLAAFASAAKLTDIDTLEKQLRFFTEEVDAEDIKRFQPPVNLQLGPIQEEYANFLKKYNELNYDALSNNERNTISRKTIEIKDYEELITLEEKRINNLSTRLKMAEDARDRIKKVYSSDPERFATDLDNSAIKVKEIEDDRSQVNKNIVGYRRNIQRIENEIAELRQETGSDNQMLIYEIRQSIENLKGEIRTWKNEHLLYAPIAGRVIFSEKFANDNQTVRSGSRILEIYPAGDLGEVYAEVDLPNFNSGSVEAGQEVVMKVDNYPYVQYGMLKGIVRNKSDIPQKNNTYKVEVELKEGMVTSFNRELEFVQGMQGTAEIITKEKRFLYRLFDNVFAESYR